jgi:hypothetical protein
VKHKYQVWRDEETRDDARTVDGIDHEDAAEEWAQEEDWSSAEYSIVSQNDEPIVCVSLVDDDDVRRFKVRGEAVPSYSATEVQP